MAWAWSAVWARAAAGEEAERIVLPQLKASSPGSVDHLSQLKEQAVARSRSNQAAQVIQANEPVVTTSVRKSSRIEVRQLRDLSNLEPSGGAIVNKGATSEGLIFAKPRGAASTGLVFDKDTLSNDADKVPAARTSTLLPSSSDRENLALKAIRRALQLDHSQISDLRQKRGIGADAIDELRQYYELKMVSGASFPSDVRLEASQVQAALDDPDFFLAFVAGLEDGEGTLKVRFIFNPLQVLAAKVHDRMTLSGVDKAEALEFQFKIAGIPL